MFQLQSWPAVILHLDGDSFFASVIQAVCPSLKDKPVVAGKERGIATAVSLEAKKYGIKRCMRLFEIKKLCPSCYIVDSDYETYQFFSQRMFDILRSFTPYVEEYSIDEAFADLKGLRRPYNMSYYELGKVIKEKIEKSLKLTVSVGISLTKSLAKLASSTHKPSGLIVVKGRSIETLLQKVSVKRIWGIGENTAAYLNKLGIYTALDFAQKPEEFIKRYLSKTYFEIWHELRGHKVYELNTSPKTTYKSITRSQTYTPPTTNSDILWARLLHHVEEAFEKARRLKYMVGTCTLFLKTQQFMYLTKEIKLLQKTSYPFLIRDELKKAFKEIYKTGVLYRSTGCTLSHFEETTANQLTLFSLGDEREIKAKRIYRLYEAKKVNFGTSLFMK